MEEITIRKRDKWIPIIFLILACSGLALGTPHKMDTYSPNPSSVLQEPSVLTVEILENQSMGWFRARLLLNVTTDIPINMSYFYTGIGASAAKIVSVNSSIFVVSNLSSQIEILIRPSWNVFPSSFQYQLTLYYINSTTQIPQNIFEIPLGVFNIIMGVPLSIILGGGLIIGIIFISVRPVRLRKKKGESSSETDFSYAESTAIIPPSSSPPQSTSSAGLEAGKIQCPECKEKIAEGSAFCPECGYHIPRFLRMKE
ncbi:MAG: hypothetical protein ACTSRE_07795 [Promethearchaeota archaeon]